MDRATELCGWILTLTFCLCRAINTGYNPMHGRARSWSISELMSVATPELTYFQQQSTHGGPQQAHQHAQQNHQWLDSVQGATAFRTSILPLLKNAHASWRALHAPDDNTMNISFVTCPERS